VWRGRAERAIAAVLVVAAIVVAAVVASRWRTDDAQCGGGFVASGARCLLPAGSAAPPDARVLVPAAKTDVGPSDWEAEGRVAPRTIETRAFYMDAFELRDDAGRARTGVTRDEAAATCAARGGRLPTEDEWIAAATSGKNARYPWGDTGAVCRRAAWGLASGPCSTRGDGADTGGAHPTGDTARGLHDMAGNAAEWVTVPDGSGVAHGGSWASMLASELRVWSRLELAPTARDPRVGARCAYDAP